MAGKADLVNSIADSFGAAAGSPEGEDDGAYAALDAAESAGTASGGWMADG
jgi:hypothetical protein